MTISVASPAARAKPLPLSGLVPAAREEVERVRDHLAPGGATYVGQMLEPFDGVRQKSLARKYREAVEKSVNDPAHVGSVEARANSALRDYHSELVRHDLVLTGSDSDLKAWGKVRAKECAEWIGQENRQPLRALWSCVRVVERYGIKHDDKFAHWLQVLEVCGLAVAGVNQMHSFFSRVASWEWWLRKARRLQARAMESYARRRGFVHARADVYVSNSSLRRRERQLERNQRALESREAVSTDGMECLLSDLAALGLANPENRFAEMVTRARGFEEVAQRRGHCADFWTLTTPSRFHRMTKIKNPDGTYRVEENPKWEREQLTVEDGQQWLRKVWQRIRAALMRRGIRFYGTRVAEPHHDGTVHWHMVLHFHPEEVADAREVAFRYMFKDDGDEWGADNYRFNMKAHDRAKGSAVGYLLKYIFKNVAGLDARGQSTDEAETLLMEAGAHRVAAWAATWGIRQFQFMGGPSVTVWREFRRLMNANREPEQLDMFGGKPKEIPGKWLELFEGMPEALRAALAADEGSWSEFVEAMGGPMLPRKFRPVHPGYWFRDVVSPVTGNRIPARQATRYGDAIPGRLLGVVALKFGEFGAFLERITTRIHDWFIRQKQCAGPPHGAVLV